ncbi:MAG: hypothetical protein AAB759_00930 [Patescibacteria group bacterium]
MNGILFSSAFGGLEIGGAGKMKGEAENISNCQKTCRAGGRSASGGKLSSVRWSRACGRGLLAAEGGEMRSNYFQNTPHFIQTPILGGGCLGAKRPGMVFPRQNPSITVPFSDIYSIILQKTSIKKA